MDRLNSDSLQADRPAASPAQSPTRLPVPHTAGESPPALTVLPAVFGPAPPAGPALSARERLMHLATAIEADIIPRLLRLHGREAPEAMPAAAGSATAPGAGRTEADVQAFARLAMGLDAIAIEQVIDVLVDRGVALEAIFLELIAPAARFLGAMWESDDCDFVDVSIGLGRLQQIVRRLSTPQGLDAGTRADGRRVVLMPAPGEQHTLGLSIVAEFFLRAGWDVTTALNADLADPVEQVRAEWFDVIGVSVATTARLDWLRTAIKDMRRASLNKSVGIMVGGPIFLLHPEYATQVGADGFAADGLHAPVEAENLLAERAKRT